MPTTNPSDHRRAACVQRVFALLASAALLLAAACSRTPPEAALRDAVAGLQSSIESRDADGVADALAEDFIGNDGLDRDRARRMAALMFMQSQSIGVTLGPLDVALQGDRATVRSTAALTGGSGRLLPDSAGVYDVVSGWRLEDGEWRMSSLEWTGK